MFLPPERIHPISQFAYKTAENMHESRTPARFRGFCMQIGVLAPPKAPCFTYKTPQNVHGPQENARFWGFCTQGEASEPIVKRLLGLLRAEGASDPIGKPASSGLLRMGGGKWPDWKTRVLEIVRGERSGRPSRERTFLELPAK